MVGYVLQPCVVGVSFRGKSVFPACVLAKAVATPVRCIERRVGKDEIEVVSVPFSPLALAGAGA